MATPKSSFRSEDYDEETACRYRTAKARTTLTGANAFGVAAGNCNVSISGNNLADGDCSKGKGYVGGNEDWQAEVLNAVTGVHDTFAPMPPANANVKRVIAKIVVTAFAGLYADGGGNGTAKVTSGQNNISIGSCEVVPAVDQHEVGGGLGGGGNA